MQESRQEDVAWTQVAARGGEFRVHFKGREKSMLKEYMGVVSSQWRCSPINLGDSYTGEKYVKR